MFFTFLFFLFFFFVFHLSLLLQLTSEALCLLESKITLSWVSLIVFPNLFCQLLLFLLISSICAHAPVYTCIPEQTHTHTQMTNSSAQSSQTASLTYSYLLYISCMPSRHLKPNKLSTISPCSSLNLFPNLVNGQLHSSRS